MVLRYERYILEKEKRGICEKQTWEVVMLSGSMSGVHKEVSRFWGGYDLETREWEGMWKFFGKLGLALGL